ncbi:speckle-type POZ protein-like [Diachasmimorpha longicaudata]|uniref:speckle-type POZ protein-like n=1 Tax=Diachasmimorpha longicaudata TaxID=58733 RepID=UPI0030B8C270
MAATEEMNPLDISKFAMSSCFSDVTIIVQNEKIPSHKLVLGAASPVLLSLLTSDMKEARENIIVIEDVELYVMKIVLKYLYTGAIVSSGYLTYLRILAVAEKYAMSSLKSLIEEELMASINATNVIEILDYANLHRANKLKQTAMQYIIHNKHNLIGSESFKALCYNNHELMMEFLILFAKR